MSLADKIRDKKQKKIYDNELALTGISLKNISYKSGGLKDSRIFLCLVRALLLFFTSFGTVASVVSAFNAPFKPAIVILCAIVICFLIAFIYYNKITFYLGYILFFIFFTLGVFSLYIYINSGFQGFMNIVYKEYSDYFKLKSLREATEIVSNRSLTITIMMIFMVAFLALLLNITISGYMSLIETFLITFPLLQIPLYINRTPKIVYLVMILGSYITIAILGRSSHHKIPDIGKKTTEFINSGKAQKRYHSYISDGHSMLINTVYGILLSAIFILCASFFLYAKQDTLVTNKLKSTTDNFIKSYLQNGVWGLFDRYEAKGGLSNGKLGGVSSIHPDFETDLTITFVPEIFNSIYLKSYVGTNYEFNHFIANTDSVYESTTYDSAIPAITETFPYKEYSSKMEISNIDIASNQYLMPYYSGEIIDTKETADGMDYSILYSPINEMKINEEPVNKPSKDYEKYVYNTYLDIPESLEPTLNDFLNEAGIAPDMYYNASKDAKKATALSIAQKVRGYIYQNYEYTMAPGSTPPGADFVDYFLMVQKRGFCAHFASASTMILREMGIPARYVEGYMLSTSDISNGQPVSTDINGWVKNRDKMEVKDTGVIKVEVNDSSAHAWTEIYLDGYGWVPYDFTPPSAGEELINDFNFASLFSGLFLSVQDNDDSEEENSDTDTNEYSKFSFDFGRSFGYTLVPILISVCIIMLIIAYYYAFPIIRARINRSKACKTGNYNTALRISYVMLLKKLFKKNNQNEFTTVNDFIEYIKMLNFDEEQPDSILLSNALDKALYSQHNIDINTYNTCMHNFEIIKKTADKK